MCWPMMAAPVAEKIAAWPAGEHPIHLTVTDKSSFNQGFQAVACASCSTGRDIGNGAHRGGTTVSPAGATPGAVVRKPHANAALDGVGCGVGVWRDWREHYLTGSLLPGMATLLERGHGLTVDLAQRYTQGDAAGWPHAHRKCSSPHSLKPPTATWRARPTCITSNVAMRRCICQALHPPPPTPVRAGA